MSAILPVRDPGPGLATSLEALKVTLSAADELVVVDDGSTDGTAALLRDTDWQGLRTTVLSPPENRGVAAARNLGLAHARGRTVWFVDWDDRWDPRIVDLLHTARVTSGAHVVGCGADLLDPQGHRRELLGAVRRPTLLTGGEIGVAILDGRIRGYLWNKLFDRDVLGEAPFPERRTQSDFAGIAERMARLPSVYLLPDVLFHHVQRPGSLTTAQHPSLESLRWSQQLGDRVAELALTHPETPADPVEVAAARRVYRYRAWHLSIAGTALRAPLHPQARRAQLRVALDGASLRDVPLLLRRDPELAARVAALIACGSHYPSVHRAVVGLRSGLDYVRDRRRSG